MALVRFILYVSSSSANRVSTHDITSPIHSVDFADHRGGGGRGREWTGGAGGGGGCAAVDGRLSNTFAFNWPLHDISVRSPELASRNTT